MKLKITPVGVWVDDQKIEGVSQVDIKNISSIKGIEVFLHLAVDEVDVQYHSKELMHRIDIPLKTISSAVHGALDGVRKEAGSDCL